MFETLVGYAVMIAGVVVWSIRQEGRINAHDKIFEERAAQAIERHEDLKARLVRIETKLDAQHSGGQ